MGERAQGAWTPWIQGGASAPRKKEQGRQLAARHGGGAGHGEERSHAPCCWRGESREEDGVEGAGEQGRVPWLLGGAMGAWSSAPCALLPWDACYAMEKKTGRLLWRLEKNEGWECKIAQVQGERAAIYRETLGLGLLSGPNGLGWASPNTLSGCAKHFPE
jgi:hypothetical protein